MMQTVAIAGFIIPYMAVYAPALMLQGGTPGAFGNFYDRIEGYSHEPGIRNVLRVDRYTIKNPPADASKYAYVLDLVVESANEGH